MIFTHCCLVFSLLHFREQRYWKRMITNDIEKIRKRWQGRPGCQQHEAWVFFKYLFIIYVFRGENVERLGTPWRRQIIAKTVIKIISYIHNWSQGGKSPFVQSGRFVRPFLHLLFFSQTSVTPQTRKNTNKLEAYLNTNKNQGQRSTVYG